MCETVPDHFSTERSPSGTLSVALHHIFISCYILSAVCKAWYSRDIPFHSMEWIDSMMKRGRWAEGKTEGRNLKLCALC